MSSTFTGAFQMMRLAIRRDRIKFTVWIVAIAALFAIGLPSLKEVYPTQQDLNVYASTGASSVVARLLAGPVDGANIGSVLMLEYFLFGGVMIAFMSTLAIIRHTRQNEEFGRSELIGSLVVGRRAPLTAALTVVTFANLILAALIFIILKYNGLDVHGSLAMSAGLAGVGIAFAAIAAICAQITESARGANALAAIVIGTAVLVRGIGDATGTVSADGLTLASNWPSWLSPIGWGQQMHPFANVQFWPLLIYLLFFVGVTATAFRMTTWRDVGAGLRTTKPGPAQAARNLSGVFGLSWRLQRGVMIGWALGLAILGTTLGISGVEYKDIFTENPQFTAVLEQIGAGGENFIDIYFSGMLAFVGIILAGYGLQSLQRLRSQEAGGQTEPLLSTNTSRAKWVASHGLWVLIGIIGLVLITGLSVGSSYIIASGESWNLLSRVVVAAFVQAPAILVLTAFSIAVFGLLPRLAIALTWSAFAFCLLVVQLGQALNLPQWAINISPFAHTPAAPSDSIDVAPLAWLTLAALGLLLVGLAAFRRRDTSSDS